MIKGLTGLLIAGLSLVALLAVSCLLFYASLPDVAQLKKCMTTEMYHVHLCENDSSYTRFSQISHYIVGAVIMSEDASFYSHQGVDIEEMKESFKKDLSEHRFARGASTITQQLAKNVFLNGSKNIVRKIEEIYLALQLEKIFTKEKILTLYLNVVEFDRGVYGVKSASEHYFNRLPGEVTPEQAAYLAFLLPNPKSYSQSFRKRKLTPFAEKMVRTILHKMVLGHKIDDSEYAEANARVGALFSDVGLPTVNPNGTTEAPEDAEGSEFQFDFKSEDPHQ